MSPEWILATCGAISLLILWTSTIIGGAIWLMGKLNGLKEEILADFNLKHAANAQTVQALEALVMRHDIQLNPEFNGTGKHVSRHQ